MPTFILAAFVVALAALGTSVVLMYNGMVSLRNSADKAWSDIDELLKQLHDELTALLEVCKGYIQHEPSLMSEVAKARAAYDSAVGPADKALANALAETAAHRIFAVAENYPELKANNTFQRLQRRITGLQAQISDRREFYNDTVRAYNTRSQRIPDTFIAIFAGFKPGESFKVPASEQHSANSVSAGKAHQT